MPTIVTKRLAPSGGDYSTLAAWQAAEQKDLVAADEIHVLECETFPGGYLLDSVHGQFVLSGWTTDATRYIVIKAAPGHEHNGKFEESAFFFRVALAGVGGVADPFTCEQAYTRFEDIEWSADGGSGSVYGMLRLKWNSTKCFVTRCLFKGASTSGSAPLDMDGNATAHETVSSKFYCTQAGSYSLKIGSDTSMKMIRANTFDGVAGAIAFYFFSTATVTATFENNIFFIDQLYDTNVGPGGVSFSAMDYCAFKSGIDDTQGTNQITGVLTTDFVNYAADDLMPAPGGALYKTGKDLTGIVSDDVVGNEWVLWDVGAVTFVPTIVTHTLRSAGGDYSQIKTWADTELRDLVAAGEREVLECYNDWPGGHIPDNDFIISLGWGVDKRCRIEMKAAAGEGHGGSLTDGFWLNFTNHVKYLNIRAAYTVVEDFRLYKPDFTSDGQTVRVGNHNRIRRCIIETFESGSATSTTACQVPISNGDGAIFESCLYIHRGPYIDDVWGWIGMTGGDLRGSSINGMRNCTLVADFDIPIMANATGETDIKHIFENCAFVSLRTETNDNPFSAGAPRITNNAFLQGATPLYGGAPITDVVKTAGVDFVDPANDDYHIAGLGSKLYNAGVATVVGKDLEGNDFVTNDIGCFALTATGPTLSNDQVTNITTDSARISVTTDSL